MLKVYALILLLFLTGLTAYSQAVGDYRSFQTGPWSDVNTWERFDGGSWVNPAPSTPTNTDGVITIGTSHVVTITSNVSVDQIEFENDFSGLTGTLIVSSGVVVTVENGPGDDVRLLNDFFTFALLQVDGTLNLISGATIVDDDYGNLGIGTLPATPDTYRVTNGGIHIHNVGASPDLVPNADWQTGSTCRINMISSNTPSISPSTSFYHFIWDGTAQGTGVIDLNSTLVDIRGDFTVISTNGNTLRLVAGTNTTLNYQGDFLIQGNSRVQLIATASSTTLNIGGDFSIASTNTGANALIFTSTGAITINVGGDFLKSNASAVNLAAAGTATAIVNVDGNFALTGGTMSCASSFTTGSASFSFNGPNAVTFVNTGIISNAVNFTIASNKLVDFGAYALTGTGTFTNNGTIILRNTHAAGVIQTSPSTNGNIQVSGTRTFAAGSTIVMGGGTQSTGNGFPSNVNVTVTNLSTVSLTNALTISTNRLLTIEAGSVLTIGTNTLTINGGIDTDTGLGFFAGSSTSNLSIGGSGAIGDFIVFSSDATAFLNDFTINRNSGTVYFRSRLTTEGSFNHTAGDMEMMGFLLRINGDYNHTAGNFIMGNTSGLWVYGSNPSTLDPFTFSTGSALYDLDMNRAGSTFTLSSDLGVSRLILNAGTFNNSGATLTMDNNSILTRRAGSMTAAPVAAGSYSVVYDNSGLMTTSFELPSGSTALANLTKSNTGTLNLNSNITINGDLNFTGSGFTAGSNTITMNGGQITSSASASLVPSTFVFNNTTSLEGGLTPVNPVFGNITISGTGDFTPNLPYSINGNLIDNGILNPNDVTFGGSTTISGTGAPSFNDVTITGTLTASSGTMNVAGDFTNNGTFNRGGGTVVFNGVTSIGGSAASTFSNLIVEGDLTAPDDNVLSLTRNFTNNGTFVHNSGTVAFTGSVQQLIQGSSLTNFYNMSINNISGSSLLVEANANLAGVLTLEGTSIFDADGSSNTSIFTLLSTDDAPPTDAAIAAIPATASFMGNVTYQRYMSMEGGNNARIYRYISSPVSGATVADLQGEIPVTGPFTGASTCSGCVTANQSMWSYNESVLGNLDQGYVNFPASTNTETFQPSRGYTLFVRGNILGGPTWNLRGPINSGTINFGISFTSTGNLADDGWNLVGNPYPSTIDWDNPAWIKSNISNVIYMRDNGRGTIASYNGTLGVNNGTNLIASGQGFWVQANAATPTLIANENVKAPGAADPEFEFFRKEAPQNFIRISLAQGNKVDETVIHFRADAKEGADPVDARKLSNESIFNLSTVTSEGRKLAINSLPSLDCSKQIPLSITEVKPGNYQFIFAELESFNNNPNIKLIDNFTNTTIDVGSGNTYSFAVTTDEFSYSAERFSLLFTLPDFDQNFAFTAADVCEEANALISIQDSKTDAIYTLYIGEEVVSDELTGNGGMLSMEVSKEKLALGENEITIRSVSSYCSSTKLDKVALVNVATKPEIQSAVVTSACLSGPVSIEVSGSPTGLYNWYRSESATEPVAEQNGNVFVTEELTKSKTYFVATVNELGCEGQRKPVVAEVVQYDPAEIIWDDVTGELSSSSATGNRWFLNGELLTGETAQQIIPELPGTYRVEISHGTGCIAADEFDFVITGNEETLKDGISVYPVPVSDFLTVKIPTTLEVEKINLHNSLGQMVGEIRLSDANGVNHGEYDMRFTPSGLYSLSVYLKSGRIAQFKVLRK